MPCEIFQRWVQSRGVFGGQVTGIPPPEIHIADDRARVPLSFCENIFNLLRKLYQIKWFVNNIRKTQF